MLAPVKPPLFIKVMVIAELLTATPFNLSFVVTDGVVPPEI